jgi:hypothetical protein
VVDDEQRENEGDLICAAQFATPEAINFMATEARGLICLAMEGQRLDELDLPLMVDRNTDANETAFTGEHRCRHRAWGDYRHLRRKTALPRFRWPSTQPHGQRNCAAPGTSFPCAPDRAACSNEPVTPKLPLIWLSWRASAPPE